MLRDVNVMKVLKRYEYYGWDEQELKPIKKWTEWFVWRGEDRPKYQMGRKLMCEYKEVEEAICHS